MSLHLPSRRVLRTAATTLRPSTVPNTLCASLQALSLSGSQAPPHCLLQQQSRSISWGSWASWGSSRKKDAAGAFADDLTKASTRQSLTDRLSNPNLSRDSIFADQVQQPETTTSSSQQQGRPAGGGGPTGASMVKEHLARAVDPDPRSRVRWQRKMVIRRVWRGLDPLDRETRAERIARTERRHASKSENLPTSTKKLVHLARQIAGKTVDDAIVQMRFSKKKMAREVRYQLELARDEAVVQRGMGLGRVSGEKEGGDAAAAAAAEPVKIQTKDGKWLSIEDPTRLYVEQAWVGKGPPRGYKIDYRARGRAHKMTRPTTSITMVIKEEKTRIREHEERQAKKARQGPWVHLPNRPVTAQRPYYSW